MAALEAEPFSSGYRIALYSTWQTPPFVETVNLVSPDNLATLGDQIGRELGRILPATVDRQPLPYQQATAVGQMQVSRVKINEFVRARMPVDANSGFRAVMTIGLEPQVEVSPIDTNDYLKPRGPTTNRFPVEVLLAQTRQYVDGGAVRVSHVAGDPRRDAPFSHEVERTDGSFQLIDRRFRLRAMKAYINLRTVPGDVLLYFDNRAEVACDIADTDLTMSGNFDDDVAACIGLMVEQLVADLETTLGARASP